MTTKELIQQEINAIDEQYLDDLYRLIKSFAEAKQRYGKPSFMSRLRAIRIDGPEDFSANLDEYLYDDRRE
ncbi:MAG: hypothetical protein M1546_24875 [Chloroflexi bacterium]|nr:hypothetical protein [Chloroflexota bacterium]